MRTIQGAIVLLLMAVGGPALAANPGTAAPASGGGVLVDATTGESWSKVAAKAPAKWTLTGPARFQVGFRLNIPTSSDEAVPAGIVMVRHGGKPLAQYRLQPRPGKETWKDEAAFKPSLAVGFLVDVAPGDQTYEFGLNGGAAAGGAVYVIDAAKSTRPLAANAPVVAIPAAPLVATAATPTPAPAPASTPAPGADAVATPAPTPEVTGTQPAGADSALSLWVGAGGGSQTRTFVTGSAPATDLALGVRWRPLAKAQLSFSAGFEQTEDLVPLPEAPVRRVGESRTTLDVGAGYLLAVSQASLVVGPSLHYAGIQNDVVGYDVIFGSLGGRAEVPVGPVIAFAGGEAGVPLADGTPGGWNDGDLANRYAWSAGLRYTHRAMAMTPSLGLEYRGEYVSRRYSELVSHGAWLVLQVEF